MKKTIITLVEAKNKSAHMLTTDYSGSKMTPYMAECLIEELVRDFKIKSLSIKLSK